MRLLPVLALFAGCAAPAPEAEPAPRLPVRSPLLGSGIRASFAAGGVTVSGLATARLSLHAWGRPGDLQPAAPVAPLRDGGRVIFERHGVDEWWEEQPDGLEQGFFIPAPPLGDGPLVLDVAVDGGSVEVDGDRAWIAGMRYDELHAWDAAGHVLPAWMEPAGRGVRLVVDDADAVGGVWIDPFLTLAWTVDGGQAGSWLGFSVAGAGDVDGDGYDDVVVGQHSYDGAVAYGGRALVFHGSPAGLGVAPAWTAEGDQVGTSYGMRVAGAGDVNGDGYDDVLVGASYHTDDQVEEGRVFAFHGSPAGLGLVAAWTEDGDQAYAFFGNAAAAAGDVNGDGYDDVVVGAHNWSGAEAGEGRASVFLGSAAGLAATPAWTGESDQAGAGYAMSVAGAGDVNGDGYDDVIVGYPEFGNGEAEEGRAYLYLGSPAGPGAVAAWTAESNQVDALFGAAVASAGDVNADGYDDVVIGAKWYKKGQDMEGRASLYLGSATGLAATPAWTAESNQVGAWFGNDVASAGDVDADGYDDVIVGSPGYTNGQANEGRAWLFHGRASGLEATAAWTGEANQAAATYGRAVASAGDVNGDGLADVVTGANFYDGPETDGGRAFVYLGTCFDPFDADGDGVGDGCDACPGHDDLLDADLDGAPDGCDDCPGVNTDGDGDTVPDACDNCPAILNITQADADLDGAGDACDACDGFDDAVDADADGAPDACDGCAGHPDGYDQDEDGAPDGCDRCPDADDRLDGDADGVPDACDLCSAGDDAADGDLDLLPDACDLCAALDGPEEAALDADSDAVPDACDTCPGFDDALDADRDGAPDACDVCADADDGLDADLDAVPDGCDVCASGPDDLDGDADGVPDACDACPTMVGGADLDGDGLAVCTGDCFEGNAAVYAGAPELPDGIDGDCDGRVDDGTIWADDDGDGATEASGDCDDVDADVGPSSVETCDGLDGDCDGLVDDGTECADDDGDGFSELAGDCVDADPLVFPGAFELLDNRVDDDCDGVVDPGHWDGDGDGYEAGDCAPDDAAVSPGAPEVPNGADDDCDGSVDEGTRAADDDGDGLTEDAGDCDDASPTTLPGASEAANRADDDCDGLVDEGTANFDDDGDGQAEIGGDCDDTTAAVSGGALEVDNGVDDDCDGVVDEGTVDVDRDGWTVEQGDCDDRSGWANPEEREVCDGMDNDCDDVVDDGCATTVEDVVQATVDRGGCDHGGGGGGGRYGLVVAGAVLAGARRRRG